MVVLVDHLTVKNTERNTPIVLKIASSLTFIYNYISKFSHPNKLNSDSGHQLYILPS